MTTANASTDVDPVPAIAESDATGNVAKLYSDIRDTLGVPVVNLIWRHLATIDGGLDFAWTTLKPVYASGEIAAQAASLNNQLDLPTLPGLSRSTLDAIDLSNRDLEAIHTVIASYERSNAGNLVAMGALLAVLNNVSDESAARSAETTVVDPVRGEMPALPSLNDMSPPVRALVDDLNTIGDRQTVMPTMYRHLAHWPAFLAQLHVLLKPLDADGRLEHMIVTATDEALRLGSTMRSRVTPPATPRSEIAEQLRTSVQLFVDEPISKMTAIGGLVFAAMPRLDA